MDVVRPEVLGIGIEDGAIWTGVQLLGREPQGWRLLELGMK